MGTISSYAAATAITDDDVFPGNDGSTTKKFPATVFRTYLRQRIYDVKDYGCVGDGVAVETTQIQNAINAAATAGGGTVYFPAGSYWFSTITLKSYVRLVCTPGTILYFDGTNGQTWFTNSTASPLIMAGFDGNGCALDALYLAGTIFDLHSIQGCTFGDFQVYNSTGYTAANNAAVFRIRADASALTPAIGGATTRGCLFNTFLPTICEGAIEYFYDMEAMDVAGPITLNTFHGVEAGNVYTTAIRLGKWVDNNVFEGHYRVSLVTANSTGLIVNDSSATELLKVAVTAAGTGYATVPTVTFTGGAGSGAAAFATVSGGLVTGVYLTNSGTGYTSAPTVGFTGGGGSGATATASLAGPTVDVETYQNTWHHFAVDTNGTLGGRTGIKLNKSLGTQVLMYQCDPSQLGAEGGTINNVVTANTYQINLFGGNLTTVVTDTRRGTNLKLTATSGQPIQQGYTSADALMWQIDADGNVFSNATIRSENGFYGNSSVRLLLGTRRTGWTAATGTATRTTFATTTVTTAQLAERV